MHNLDYCKYLFEKSLLEGKPFTEALETFLESLPISKYEVTLLDLLEKKAGEIEELKEKLEELEKEYYELQHLLDN